MASEFSHAVVALALGQAYVGRTRPPHFWSLSILCSILPDVDLVGFAFGIEYGDLLGHRGLTHSLCFALFLSVLVVRLGFAGVAGLSRRWWTMITYFFFVIASHGFLDAMTNGGLGVAFFAPFDTTRYFLPWTPVQVAPIGLTAFFGPLGLQVLASEFLWIWIPAGLLIVGMTALRTWTSQERQA